MKQTKLWDAAIHEAAHLVVFVKAGGKPTMIGEVMVLPSGNGYIQNLRPDRLRFTYLGDAAVTAAGVACEQIRGIEPCELRGSDIHNLRSSYCSESEVQLIVAYTRRWLEKQWHHVEWAADRLAAAPRRRGVISPRTVREIVKELANRLCPAATTIHRGRRIQ